MNETGTKSTPPVKGPARSTSSGWVEPDTHSDTQDKSGAPGCVDNVGKSAGAQSGKKGGKTKVW